MAKTIASLSCDLDDKWSYMKTHGDQGWELLPSYLDVVVPRILLTLKERDLPATFFIVGQDAALAKNIDLFRGIVEAGHEGGNHSFKHEPWLHLYSREEIGTEIAMAEDHIERATGQRPVGFRGPGYSLSEATVSELVRRGYLYDATTFPTFLTPLVRLYYFATANFNSEEKCRRKLLGGTLRDGLRPNRPYYWHVDGKQLFEIPVTTLPVLKFPIHMSYLFGLSRFSPKLAMRYFDLGMRLCRLANVEPSIVLHPTDFLGMEDAQGLSFIPGMRLPLQTKLEFVGNVLDRVRATFSVMTLREYATVASRRAALAVLSPSF
ncbi:MAG: polysaccharide deacetylase family protein [Nitrospiraceae bacterium]